MQFSHFTNGREHGMERTCAVPKAAGIMEMLHLDGDIPGSYLHLQSTGYL